MSVDVAQMPITFRCPPGLEPFLPRPVPAVIGLPDWFKALPANTFSTVLQMEQMTVKKCPPFIDAMTYGFLFPLATDVRVENGTFSWDFANPGGAGAHFNRSPVSFHDNVQVAGTPLFDADQFVLKFNNFWTIETPPGYSMLITHPFNRPDLPFTTLTGLVDCDRYSETFINFPARWHDPEFNGVLPKGTPVAQCVPMRRDVWQAHFETMASDEVGRLQQTAAVLAREEGIYRREFRAPKR